MHRGFRFALYPTDEQAETLGRWIGACRLIYNVALQQRETQWRQFKENTGKNISFASQSRELTAARAEVDWIAAVPRMCLEAALMDLDVAFANFFSGRARYPRHRIKGRNDTLRFRGAELRVAPFNAKWASVSLAKLGTVKFRATRPIAGTIKAATVSYRAGRWFVSILCEIESGAAVTDLPSVGIDRGVANTITLSTGEHLSLPASLTAIERRQRRAKRVLSRKKRGSVRYARQRRRVAEMSARCARIRLDWHHRTTTALAQRFGAAVVEDLTIANMTAAGSKAGVRQKAGLNRSILNQGWFVFETLLAYKLEERGGQLVKVPAAYTSQTCSACGTIDRESRESQASFTCRHCGFAAHADVNAAINILRGSTPSMRVEARESPADEARTRSGLSVENHSALAA